MSDDENEGGEDEDQQEDNHQVEIPPQPQAVADDHNLCILCFENEKNAVMVPCGHSSFCYECGNKCIRTFTGPDPLCPLCRQPIERCIQMI